MGSSGDLAQFLDRGFGQLLLVLQKAVEDGFGQRRFELEADEFVAMPDDPAMLRLEAGDVEPQPGIWRGSGNGFDAAAVGRNVDQPRLDLPAVRFADCRLEAQRRSARAPAVGFNQCFRGLAHVESSPATLMGADREQMVAILRFGLNAVIGAKRNLFGMTKT